MRIINLHQKNNFNIYTNLHHFFRYTNLCLWLWQPLNPIEVLWKWAIVDGYSPQNRNWLVVSTPLKNISQWEGLSHILWKIKIVPNHQPELLMGKWTCLFLWALVSKHLQDQTERNLELNSGSQKKLRHGPSFPNNRSLKFHQRSFRLAGSLLESWQLPWAPPVLDNNSLHPCCKTRLFRRFKVARAPRWCLQQMDDMYNIIT